MDRNHQCSRHHFQSRPVWRNVCSQGHAFEFASWISIEFKLYIIQEFQRLKADENDRLKLDWNLQRHLAKVNYHIHTSAIKENLVPKELSKQQINCIYANEADR